MAEERGNGGKVLVCENQNDFDVELLDLFEAREISEWNFTLNLDEKRLNYMDKVKLVLERVKKFDPYRSARYEIARSQFEANAKFLHNADLPNTVDVGLTSIPDSCQLIQIAIQLKPELPGQKLYTIDGDLWEKLDENNKAALVLHEIIYGEASERMHIDSTKVRYFNALLTSNELLNYTQNQFDDFLSVCNLLESGEEFDEIVFDRKTIRRYPSGSFQSGQVLVGNQNYIRRYGAFEYHTAIHLKQGLSYLENGIPYSFGYIGAIRMKEFKNDKICESLYGYVYLNEDGSPREASEARLYNGTYGYFHENECLVTQPNFSGNDEKIYFFPGAVPKSIPSNHSTVAVFEKTVVLRTPTLSPSGFALSGFVNEPLELMCSDGVVRLFSDTQEKIFFNEDGRVKVGESWLLTP